MSSMCHCNTVTPCAGGAVEQCPRSIIVTMRGEEEADVTRDLCWAGDHWHMWQLGNRCPH